MAGQYVIKGGARNQYVARPGMQHSYTPWLHKAQTFLSRHEAELSKCGNESVLSIDQAMREAE